MTHQFEIFKSGEVKTTPLKKMISPERLREVQALMKAGNDKEAVIKLRELRYSLENYLKRIK